MKVKDVLAVLGVAAATAAFVVVLLGPQRVDAVDEAQGIQPRIAQPKLTIEGCEITLKTDKPVYQPGETVTVQIEATNPTDQPVETSVWVTLSATEPASEFSRKLVMPRPLWSGECKVVLAPGETKTFTRVAEAELPAGQSISISMSDQQTAAMITELLQVQQNGTQVQAADQVAPIMQLVPQK
ncbi:MAG TPA: hypothetical protein VMY42_20070 [Thermoguttaceae bacterium]|nr:hypothetical protein [Thermoguttaceae bacterium]